MRKREEEREKRERFWHAGRWHALAGINLREELKKKGLGPKACG